LKGLLTGLTLVVTRPAAQAAPFIAAARAEGARCIAIPAIEIEPVEPDAGQRRDATADRYDWIVFTSANAVTHGLPRLPAPIDASVLAVGRATARALEQRSVRVAARPDSASSEGILALPEIAAPRGQRILLVKGRGGRELLRDELASRGAHVAQLEVYVRRPADPSADSLRALREALQGTLDCVIAVTSQEILELFVANLDATDAQRARKATLLVPGPRVAKVARRLRWDGPVVEAATAEDGAMLEALRVHRRGPAAPA
jgi:uroporphyrinogen-III synthase